MQEELTNPTVVNLTHLFGNGITPGAIEPLELYPLRSPAEENMQCMFSLLQLF